jgi:hypothetical protein
MENNARFIEAADSALTITDSTIPAVSACDNIVLFHAAGIKTAWSKSVAAFIEAGQLLLAAKKAMSGTGKWLQLFDKKIGDLPFGVDTAERLMNIARHKELSDSANWRNLPPSIRTLAVLSKVRSPKKWETWFADGTVTADTELKTAESLVSPKPAKAKAVKKDTADSDATVSDDTTTTASNTAASNEVQQSVQRLYTLACDATADWTAVDLDMVRDLIEELHGRLNARAEAARHEKEWREAEAAKRLLPH